MGGGHIIFSHYNSRARGVAVLFRKNLDFEVIKETSSKNGRFLIVELGVSDLTFVLINVYAPNEDKPEFFDALFTIAKGYENPFKLFGGDFNVIRDPQMDKIGVIQDLKPNSSKNIDNYMNQLDLIDHWRHLNPDVFRYTWIRNRPNLTGSHLDYWLVSSCFVQYCQGTDIPAAFISDHAPITIEIKTTFNQRGRGVCMMNNSLLEDKEYVDRINALIEEVVVDHPDEDPRLVYEAIKLRIRGETICYSTYKKKSRENKVEALTKKLQNIEESLCSDHEVFVSDSEKWSQLNKICDELYAIQEEKTKGAMIRSKATFLEFGEKMSSYYFQLEKNNYKKKNIQKLMLDDGTTITHGGAILRYQKEFFEQLYAQRELEF